MLKQVRAALALTAFLTVLTGIIYPALVTGVALGVLPDQAHGSLLRRPDGSVLGSRLLAQGFTSERYFHPRPSAAGKDGYDAAGSSGSNLAPTSKALIERVTAAHHALKAENADAPIPVDLVTTSGSGLDPDLSPAAAVFQVPRVAKARGLGEDRVRALVAGQIVGRQLGVLGEPRVNVLALNMALDGLQP